MKKIIQKTPYVSVFFIVIFFSINAYFESKGMAILLLLANIGFLLSAIYADVLDVTMRRQLLLLCTIIEGGYAICFLRVFRKINGTELVYAVVTILMLLVTVLLLFKKSILITKKIFNVLESYADIILVATIFVVLSFRYIDNYPICDSGDYYKDSIKWMTERYTFFFNNVLDYSMCSHLSVAYGLCMMIGVMITPHRVIGCYIINDLIGIVTIVCFAMIIRYHLNCNKWYRLILLSIFSFSPWMLGLATNINLDNPTLYFFIIMYCCYIYRLKLLYVVSAWMFVNTKEPSAIYFFFFAISILIYEYKSNKIGINEFIKLSITEIVAYITIGATWLLFFLSPNRIGYWVGSNMIYGGSFHTIGFTVENMMAKLKQLFILDFNWLLMILIFILLIISVKNKSISKKSCEFIPLIGTLIGIILFNIFYIDVIEPRYLQLGSGILYIIAVILIQNMDKVKAIIGTAYAVLLLVQSYTTIDYVSVAAFDNIALSEGYYVPVPVQSGQLLNYTYNSELINYRYCYEAVLREAECTETDAVCFRRNNPCDDEFYDPDTGRINTRQEGNSFVVNKVELDQADSWNGRVIYMVPYHDAEYYQLDCEGDGYSLVTCGRTSVYYKVVDNTST